MKRAQQICASMTVAFTWGLVLSPAFAQTNKTPKVMTASETRQGTYTQYENLQKITVGPEDNFQATVSPDEDFFVFTEKLNFTPSIHLFDRRTSQKQKLLDEAGDSDQPAIHADGNRVLYRYFKNEARGEICILTLSPRGTECPKLPVGERYSPTWVSDNEFAFLLRESAAQKPKLILHNLTDNSSRVLYEGFLSSPTAFHNAREILVIESLPQEDKNWFVVIPLNGGKVRTYVVEVQGRSGFPALSADDKYVYFAHFVSDSNNDQIIDANDRGVIFRFPLAEAEKNGSIFPQQLTSLEQNCSYPWPNRELFITCAFEGSLDIYKLPLSGLIPTTWDLKTLRNAHDRARSYEERLLLLNRMSWQDPSLTGPQRLMRFYSNYFYLEDDESTLFILRKLKGTAAVELSAANIAPKDLQWTELMVQLWQALALETAPVASGTLEVKALSLRRKGQALPKDEVMSRLFAVLNEQVFQRGAKAQTLLNQFQKIDFHNALQAQIYYRLVERQLKFSGVSTKEGAKLFEPLLKTSVLKRDDKLVFAFFACRFLDAAGRAERVDVLRAWQARGFAAPLPEVFQSELNALEVARLREDAAKRKLWLQMDQQLQEYKDDYFLRRVLAMRMILNFAQEHEFKFLYYAASSFTKFVERKDVEYNYAMRFLISVLLDQGYLSLSKGENISAAGSFYGSVLATDDLESHFNFIRAKYLAGEAKDLPVRYEAVRRNQFASESLIFADAMLELYANLQNPNYDKLVEQLESMADDQSAIRFLVLGNAYLHKLLQTKIGADFDRGLADRAHRNLLLSLDQARENARVRAPALENLGVLHAVIANYGLSAKYYEQRAALPFLTLQDEAAIYWQWSKSLFRMGDESRAYEILRRVTEKANFPKEWQLPFQAQLGFLAVVNQSYDEALKHLQDMDGKIAKLTSRQQMQLDTLRGVALLRTGKAAAAKSLLQRVQQVAESPEINSSFVGQRQRLHALGLLAQATADQPSEQVRLLLLREDLLLGLKSRLRDLKMKEDLWLEEILKNRVRLCAFGSGLPNFAHGECIQKVSVHLQSLKQVTKQNFSNAAFRSLDAVFFLSQLNKVNLPKELQSELAEQMRDYVKDAKRISVKTPILVFQMGKMELFADALAAEASGRKLSPTEVSAKFAELKSLEPALFQRAEVLIREISTAN